VLDFLRKGDVLMVTRIDRLARSIGDLETNLRREPQLEGIAKAKAAGVYKGRPASIDAAQVCQMKEQGIGATEIAKMLGIGRASVYRTLE
jgi:DNA invertase Pin-like site-specific DNA recombinase